VQLDSRYPLVDFTFSNRKGDHHQSQRPVDAAGVYVVVRDDPNQRPPYAPPDPKAVSQLAGWLRRTTTPLPHCGRWEASQIARVYELVHGLPAYSVTTGDVVAALSRAEIGLTMRTDRPPGAPALESDMRIFAHCEIDWTRC